MSRKDPKPVIILIIYARGNRKEPILTRLENHLLTLSKVNFEKCLFIQKLPGNTILCVGKIIIRVII